MAQNKLCEICQENPATVHLTEMADQHVTQERHMCDACAQKQGVVGKMQVSITELLGSMKDRQKGGKEVDVKCPECGISYAEFRAKARFGCANDYDIFKKHVVGLLEKIHGAVEHNGKRPGAPKAAPAVSAAGETAIAEMERELEKLLKAEEYEKAAKLRDRIREVKGKKEA